MVDQVTPAGRSRLDDAQAELDALDGVLSAEHDRLIELLDTSKVNARVDSDLTAGRPLHLIVLDVERAAIDKAIAIIEAAGYRRLAPTRRAQWRAYRATQSGCSFVRTDRQPFRIELGWPDPAFSSGFAGRLVTPHPSDFEAYDLPARMWAGYSLIHLARLPSRLLRRRHDPADLGPFLQTPDALIEPLLRFADLRSDELLIDLGSGDGRIPIAAAEQFGCRARGIEYDAELVALAQHRVAESLVSDRVEVVMGDAASAPLHDAGVVVAFLPVDTLRVLIPEILTRLRPGARLIVHEQERLDVSPAADVQAPLISAGGVTVVHRWNR